ncbi:hypothetical protein ALMP_44210 [Streptomyces sp. A012304]|nr:hypothetical protein ALMP_44210 [Streptomyces sp. A012304]
MCSSVAMVVLLDSVTVRSGGPDGRPLVRTSLLPQAGLRSIDCGPHHLSVSPPPKGSRDRRGTGRGARGAGARHRDRAAATPPYAQESADTAVGHGVKTIIRPNDVPYTFRP